MSEKTNVDIDKLAVGGPGLSFIGNTFFTILKYILSRYINANIFIIFKVYPEALSLMPFPWIWCVCFFLMMITIGLEFRKLVEQ